MRKLGRLGTMLDVATELDLALVPGFESELRCEVEHSATTCSGPVTHLSTAECISATLFECANAAAYEVECREAGMGCEDCDRPIVDCWTLRPV